MPEPSLPERARPTLPWLVRVVGLLDLFLGLWAVAIAAGYVYLRFENYRMTINGAKVNWQGAFFALVVNTQWAAHLAGMDEVPGGAHNSIPGTPTVVVFSTFRVMGLFVPMAAAYLGIAVACLALADGLTRGLRWARRAQAALGWLGLATVAGYAVLYLLSPDAPRVGLFVVAGAATVPVAMIRAARVAREGDGAPGGRRSLGLPAWSLIAAGLMLVAFVIHVVLAWWSLLIVKAYFL